MPRTGRAKKPEVLSAAPTVPRKNGTLHTDGSGSTSATDVDNPGDELIDGDAAPTAAVADASQRLGANGGGGARRN
jgi:hypothetical protein